MLVRWKRWVGSALAAIAASGAFACTSDPGYKGRSSPEWIDQLAHGTPDARVDAAYALAHVLEMQPDSRRVVRALVGALRDTVDDVRVAAAVAMRGAGTRAVGAIPLLAELLADSCHREVRARAVSVLGDIGRHAPQQATELLRGALGDPVPENRANAARALGNLGPGARGAVADLTGATRDRDAAVRLASLEALARIGVRTNPVIKAFLGALTDSSTAIRRAAAMGAARVAGTNGEVVNALMSAARDRSAWVRVAAVYSLGMAGDTTARDALRRALADPDSGVRREAAHALDGFHRRGGEDTVPEP